MISHLGDPTLNKSSEWFCAKCGHSEAEHNLTLSTCEAAGELFGVCNCDGFEDKE